MVVVVVVVVVAVVNLQCQPRAQSSSEPPRGCSAMCRCRQPTKSAFSIAPRHSTPCVFTRCFSTLELSALRSVEASKGTAALHLRPPSYSAGRGQREGGL